MLFSDFSKYLEKLEKTPSRLEMMYQLAELFEALEEDEIIQTSYLMQGSLVPLYLSLEFQLSVKMVIRSLARLDLENEAGSQEKIGQKQDVGQKTGGEIEQKTSSKFEQITEQHKNISVSETSLFEEVDPDFKDLQIDSAIKKLTKEYKQDGDVGNITEKIVDQYHQQHNLKSMLSILDVYQSLKEIALENGQGSQDRKVSGLSNLIMNLDGISAKFVTRIIVGKLRLGFSAMTMFDALSWSIVKSKAHRNLLENAYQKRADVGELAKIYIQLSRKLKSSESTEANPSSINFEENLATELDKNYLATVGTPIIPALCQRLNSSEEIIEKMGEVMAEPKYDGLRIQIHYSKNGFNILGIKSSSTTMAFTRNLEDVSYMFPELEKVAKTLSCDDCILDAEAIGYDLQTEKLLPFQETITRKRKHLVEEQSKKVPIRFYVFDCLFLNNKSLIEEKLQVRKDLLREIFQDNQTIKFTQSITTSDPKELKEFHVSQLANGLEGAVMKQLNSKYKSGRKGWKWVKIKEEEGSSGKLKDTLDLVVMGYYFGKGKRSQFGVGAFLVGVLNDKQELKTIAKIGTGLTDDQFKELKTRVDLLEVSSKPEIYTVEKNLFPDIWVKPELVVEIAADEITKSPSHTAGVALRFPRLVKFRDDKNWTDATTISELANF
ncbi:ATP-dependent DNA ligase [Candidatus Woesebacteria bacterium]|nr:ATP-dependent DNA ligase [Candidatus Woesebacteria bacterium]